MRNALRDVNGIPDHPGLAYDVWAPVAPGTGKVADRDRSDWLDAVAESRPPADYAFAFERWREAVKDGPRAIVESRGRILVGSGNTSAADVGITLHHTWGVPIVPGSALKGLLSHWVDLVYGPDADDRDGHPAQAEGERQRFRAPERDGPRVVHGPGGIHRALFGAPAATSDEELRRAGVVGVGETQGGVVFHDALFVPRAADDKAGGVDLPFAPDVLTVHQKSWYDGSATAPTDWDEPVPVGFLTVRPGARFLLALGGDPELAELAMTLLIEALDEWGVGSKTSVGYGRLSGARRLKREVHDAGLDALRAELDAAGKELAAIDDAARAVEFFRQLVGRWRERFEGMAPDVLREAMQTLRSALANRMMVSKKAGKKVRAYLDELERELGAR